jgi:hypothetical protein
MALITGSGGAISGTGINGLVKSWSANIGQTALDATHFGAFGKRILNGNLTVTGSCVATMDDTSSPFAFLTATSPVTITLTASSGNTFAFPAQIVNVDAAVDSAGEALATYNFELSSTSTSLTSVAGLFTAAWT